MKFYSKSTGGFYDSEINGDNMPDDVVEVTDEEQAALLEGQLSEKQIVGDSEGKPMLADRIADELSVSQLRQRAYPPITEQLDALWKGGDALEAMREQILGVKTKYPKKG